MAKRRFEVLDPMPVEKPVGWQRPEPLDAMIRRLVRGQISSMAAQQGEETFEEANDFDIPDDIEPISPYELRQMVPDSPPGYLPDRDASRIDQKGSGGVKPEGSVSPQREARRGDSEGSEAVVG
jgi:hypothetical protein